MVVVLVTRQFGTRLMDLYFSKLYYIPVTDQWFIT